jgi:hypothetical protein
MCYWQAVGMPFQIFPMARNAVSVSEHKLA